MTSHDLATRRLNSDTTLGRTCQSVSTSDSASHTDSWQISASDVLSSGSTKPLALPMAITFFTHDRSQRPLTNFTIRLGPTFGFFERNSASAASSLMKAPE